MIIRPYERGPQAVASVQSRTGLSTVEAETASATTGAVITPTDAWTGESRYGGGKYLALDADETASFALPTAIGPRRVEPVSWLEERGGDRSTWRQGDRMLGTLRHRVGAQGVTAKPGALLPQDLDRRATRRAGPIEVRATAGTVDLDALIIRPMVSSLVLTGSSGRTELVHSIAPSAERVSVGLAGQVATLRKLRRRRRADRPASHQRARRGQPASRRVLDRRALTNDRRPVTSSALWAACRCRSDGSADRSGRQRGHASREGQRALAHAAQLAEPAGGGSDAGRRARLHRESRTRAVAARSSAASGKVCSGVAPNASSTR